jgi:pilus assembly protein CpaF
MPLADSVNSGKAGSTDELAATEVALMDSKDAVVRNLHYLLIEEMGTDLTDPSVEEGELRARIEHRLAEYLAAETTPLSAAERRKVMTDVVDNILGYGPIQEYLDDPEVTEVMVNNASTIYVERYGKIHTAEGRFIDEAHLLRIIDKIVAQVGRRIDESSPMVDARLPDGSRVNAIISPLAINGPMLTVRKFSQTPYTAEDLISFGTLSGPIVEFLSDCVRGKLNILISGGTGTGKTTLLNVVSSYVPNDERIVTIEDAAELRLDQEHVLRLESRPANIEGKGLVTIRDLVRNSLRMRPDRIIVGEVRGGEALDMLQAMNTGHEGSLSTIHANSPRDALSRLETMVLMSGFDLPVRAIREQSSAALDLVVHLSRLSDGARRVTRIAEIESMEGETIVMQDIFRFDYSAGMGADGHHKGRLRPTGLRPKFAEHLEDMGIEFPAELFSVEHYPEQ